MIVVCIAVGLHIVSTLFTGKIIIELIGGILTLPLVVLIAANVDFAIIMSYTKDIKKS